MYCTTQRMRLSHVMQKVRSNNYSQFREFRSATLASDPWSELVTPELLANKNCDSCSVPETRNEHWASKLSLQHTKELCQHFIRS